MKFVAEPLGEQPYLHKVRSLQKLEESKLAEV